MVLGAAQTGDRRPRWRAELLDRADSHKRPLHELVGGTLESSAFARVQGGGSLRLILRHEDGGVEGSGIDWGSDRVRVWYSPDAGATEWPCGLFLLEAPEQRYRDSLGVVEVEVTLQDKTSVLDQDAIEATFALPAGSDALIEVQALIESTGESFDLLDLSDEDGVGGEEGEGDVKPDPSRALPHGLAWEPGTSKLDIVNDVLNAINYSRLWADGFGTLRTGPYVLPGSRPVVHTFEEGESSLHLPDWTSAQDWFSIPNKVILITSGDDEEEGMVGVAVNVDPESPYSIPRRGRVISLSEEGVEATTQEVLNNLAARRLIDATYRVTNLEVAHAPLDLQLNDRVAFVTRSRQTTATVVKSRVSLTTGALVEAVWRQITDPTIEIMQE